MGYQQEEYNKKNNNKKNINNKNTYFSPQAVKSEKKINNKRRYIHMNDQGFFKTYRAVLCELHNSKVKSSSIDLYFTLLSHRNNETNLCYPSYSTLVEEMHRDKKTIVSSLKELEEKDFIRINSGKQGVANNYYFPKEPFYEEWKMDRDQLSAHRRKKNFKKKEVDTTKWWLYDDEEECENDDGLLSWG